MAINEQVISKALDWAYEKAVKGDIPGTSDAYELAEQFSQKKGDLNDQISALIRCRTLRAQRADS